MRRTNQPGGAASSPTGDAGGFSALGRARAPPAGRRPQRVTRLPSAAVGFPADDHFHSPLRVVRQADTGQTRETVRPGGAYPIDEALRCVGWSSRAGTPATFSPAGTSLVTTAPAPTRAPRPMRTPPRITLPDPRLAPCSTTVRRSVQSSAFFRRPSAFVARGTLSLMKTRRAPRRLRPRWSTPSQTNVWLWILQRPPTHAALDLDERADREPSPMRSRRGS